MLDVCWQWLAMYWLYHPWFEFSLKVKVMGLNPGYLLKSFLLYRWQAIWLSASRLSSSISITFAAILQLSSTLKKLHIWKVILKINLNICFDYDYSCYHVIVFFICCCCKVAHFVFKHCIGLTTSKTGPLIAIPNY